MKIKPSTNLKQSQINQPFIIHQKTARQKINTYFKSISHQQFPENTHYQLNQHKQQMFQKICKIKRFPNDIMNSKVNIQKEQSDDQNLIIQNKQIMKQMKSQLRFNNINNKGIKDCDIKLINSEKRPRKESTGEKKQIILKRQTSSRLGVSSKNCQSKFEEMLNHKLQKPQILSQMNSQSYLLKQQKIDKQISNDQIKKQIKILKTSNQKLNNSLKSSRIMSSSDLNNRKMSKPEKNSQNVKINDDQKAPIEIYIDIRHHEKLTKQIQISQKIIKQLEEQKQNLSRQIKFKTRQIQKNMYRQNQLMTQNMVMKQKIQKINLQNNQFKINMDQMHINNNKLYELLKAKIKQNEILSKKYQTQIKKMTQLLKVKEQQVQILKLQIQKLFQVCNIEMAKSSRSSISSLLNQIHKKSELLSQDFPIINQINTSFVDQKINNLIQKQVKLDKNCEEQNSRLVKTLNELILNRILKNEQNQQSLQLSRSIVKEYEIKSIQLKNGEKRQVDIIMSVNKQN